MANDVFGIVGTTVAGAFRVEAVVAEGGFAVVYRAHHEGFRAPVALKCLKIPQYMNDEQRRRFEEQFQAEAELLFKLSASIPTVVRPLHVEAVVAPDGSFMPFLALEWLEGETLDAVAKRRRAARQPPFTLAELVPALTPVARALERAHNFVGKEGPISIVHRDMKPENVFVARVAGESVMKILDFGIGKAKSMATQAAGRASQEDVGVSSFTPAYGAPEQWLPKRYGQTGPWTDVWGLALTLVELLAGKPVIDGDQAAMMGAVLDPTRRPTPRAEGIAIGDAAEAVFQRALALDPRERFGHAGDFWNALVAAEGADAERRRANQSGGHRSAGGAGTLPSRAPPSGLGRHNLIPDLEPRRAQSAALELAVEPPRGPARSGNWPATSHARVSTPAPEPDDQDLSADALLSDRAGPPVFEPPVVTRSSRPSAGVAPPAEPLPSGRGVSVGPGVWGASRSSLPIAPSGSIPPAAPPTLLRRQVAAGPEDIWRRFMAPAGLVAAGIVITIIDGAYAGSKGEVFSLGPLRLGWLAAVLALGGIGLAIRRLLRSEG